MKPTENGADGEDQGQHRHGEDISMGTHSSTQTLVLSDLLTA
jgi:hypothetical protein